MNIGKYLAVTEKKLSCGLAGHPGWSGTDISNRAVVEIQQLAREKLLTVNH
jgi:hypothetical protein